MLEPMLERCDERRLVAALETSAPDNLRFYERLGFAVRERVTVPDGGPPVWLMRREPGPARVSRT